MPHPRATGPLGLRCCVRAGVCPRARKVSLVVPAAFGAALEPALRRSLIALCPYVAETCVPGSPFHSSFDIYYFVMNPEMSLAQRCPSGHRGRPREPGVSTVQGACVGQCLCSNLKARTGLLNCGHPTLIVFLWRGPNACSLPGSVKLEAPCQRSRVHWLGTRMPWRDYNFSKRRDLAGGAGFLPCPALLVRGRLWDWTRLAVSVRLSGIWK